VANRRAAARQSAARTWNIGGVDFIQDELTFFEKNDVFALILDALQESISSGKTDLSKVAEAFEFIESQDGRNALMSLRQGERDPKAVEAAMGMGQFLLQLVSTAPGILKELYLIVLSVPEHDRAQVSRMLDTIDDDTGFGIMELFVEQNAETLRDFGKRWWETAKSMVTTSQAPVS